MEPINNIVYDFMLNTENHRRTSVNPKELSAKTSLFSPLVRIEDHKSEVLACDFHPWDDFFVSGNQDGQIHICSTQRTSPRMVEMKGHRGPVMEAHFNRNGSDIYTCSGDKTIAIWDASLGYLNVTLHAHTDGVNSVQGSRQAYPILCSGSKDNTTRVWDVRSEECTMLLRSRSQVNATCFNENGEYVISGGLDKKISIWDLRTKTVINKLCGHTGAVTGVALSPCGSYLLSHSVDSSLRIWDIRPFVTTNRCIVKFFSNYADGLLRCAWSPDGSMVSAGTGGKNVLIWNAKSGKKLHELYAHESIVNAVAFHPKEDIVLSASNDKHLYLHEINRKIN